MVRTLHFHCMGHSLIPGWGPQIPQASKQENSKNLKKKKKKRLIVGCWRLEGRSSCSQQLSDELPYLPFSTLVTGSRRPTSDPAPAYRMALWNEPPFGLHAHFPSSTSPLRLKDSLSTDLWPLLDHLSCSGASQRVSSMFAKRYWAETQYLPQGPYIGS